jgi:hypothetical protein
MPSRLLLLLLLVPLIAIRAADLTNQDIVKMFQGGLSEDTIIKAIVSKPGAYDTGPEALVELKREQIPESIIRAMIDHPSSSTLRPPSIDLPSVKRIYVGSLGNDEGAETIRAKLINQLSSAGPWTVVESDSDADAVLTGSAVVKPFGGGYQAVLALRLLDPSKRILWSCDIRSKPPKRAVLSMGKIPWSTSSSVAEQAVKKLMDAR